MIDYIFLIMFYSLINWSLFSVVSDFVVKDSDTYEVSVKNSIKSFFYNCEKQDEYKKIFHSPIVNENKLCIWYSVLPLISLREKF